jgi:hypothetical protein
MTTIFVLLFVLLLPLRLVRDLAALWVLMLVWAMALAIPLATLGAVAWLVHLLVG